MRCFGLLKKNKFFGFNDGFVKIYSYVVSSNSFNAISNASGSLSDLAFVGGFWFKILSNRLEDLEFANGMGFSLSLKIRIPFNSLVSIKHKAFINGVMYDISYIDFDKSNKCMYLFLEEVRGFA